MARITVEDCIDKFPSRFELVLVASNRARKLHSGENPTVEIDNDKNTVIALREIAEEKLTKDQLKNDLIEQYQTTTFTEEEDVNELEQNTIENKNDENIDNLNQFENNDESQMNNEIETGSSVDDSVQSTNEGKVETESSVDDSVQSTDEGKEQDL